MQAYRIKGWNELYESNKSRDVETLTYFMQPNKLAGEGVGLMLMQPDGLELYGVFGFIKMLASTAPRAQRGWLIRNGTALTPERMAALTRIPAAKFERALEFFSTAPMDWIEQAECPPGAPPGHRGGTAAAPSGHLVGTSRAEGGHVGGSISPRLKTDSTKTEDSTNKEIKRSGAGPEEAKQQARQFSALAKRRDELEGIGEEDRSAEDEAELKKVRGTLRRIQKKQAAGDFTPVVES